MAVRLGSAHFNDVMIGFPSRRIDGWWECSTVIKVDEITQPWTLSSFLSLVEYYSGQYSGKKKLYFGFFYKRLAYGILPTARIWLGRKNFPHQSNSDDEEG